MRPQIIRFASETRARRKDVPRMFASNPHFMMKIRRGRLMIVP